jgi:fatty acid desaturase
VKVAIGRLSADAAVRALVRERLPDATFQPKPSRALLLVPVLAAIGGIVFVLVTVDMRWYLALALAVVLGNIYGSLMFLTHEIGHGAVVRSRRLATALMYPGCIVFLFSPHLWVIWHNRSHHGHTNRPDQDPDSFGTLAAFAGSPRWHRVGARLYPGPGFLHAGLCIFLAAFFTVQAQSVLWTKSRSLPGYESLHRRRAVAESAAMLAFWAAVAVATGWWGTVFLVVVPWFVANTVVLSYVATNHMLRPLSPTTDSLKTTMGVSTFRLLDRLHMHFSHHVEHHLFPGMPTSSAPAVRAVLRTSYDGDYLSPPHGRALVLLLRTSPPRPGRGDGEAAGRSTSREQRQRQEERQWPRAWRTPARSWRTSSGRCGAISTRSMTP